MYLKPVLIKKTFYSLCILSAIEIKLQKPIFISLSYLKISGKRDFDDVQEKMHGTNTVL